MLDKVRDRDRTKVHNRVKDLSRKAVKVKDPNKDKDLKDLNKVRTKDLKVRVTDNKTPKTKVRMVVKVVHNNRVDKTKVRVRTKAPKDKVHSRVKDLSRKAVKVRDNRDRTDSRDKATKVRDKDNKTPKTKVKVSPRINRTKVRDKVKGRWMNTQ